MNSRGQSRALSFLEGLWLIWAKQCMEENSAFLHREVNPFDSNGFFFVGFMTWCEVFSGTA